MTREPKRGGDGEIHPGIGHFSIPSIPKCHNHLARTYCMQLRMLKDLIAQTTATNAIVHFFGNV
jgi:hypothetical protein